MQVLTQSLCDFTVKDVLLSSSVFFGRWSSSFSCHPGQKAISERPGWRRCPLAGAGAESLANGPGCGCWVCADELQARCAEAAGEQSQRAAVRLHQLLPLWRGKSQRQRWQLNLTPHRSETALWIIDNNTTVCVCVCAHTYTQKHTKCTKDKTVEWHVRKYCTVVIGKRSWLFTGSGKQCE